MPSGDRKLDRLQMYRELQRSVPGLTAIYRLAEVMVSDHPAAAPRVLVVGAGGGREIEAILAAVPGARITAVDPSADNLALARDVASPSSSVRYVEGRVEDLPGDAEFDVVTSLLVMHHISGDSAKRAYLRAIQERLAVEGAMIHADVCLDDQSEFARLEPIYSAHARHIGVNDEARRLELRTVPTLPVISSDHIRTLFVQAGLATPREVYRTLWYRCWVSRKLATPLRESE